ncbi:amidohydrolase/deacetylase family metallohydrolase [Candidatus Latescibacterota bacterium]
MPTRRALLAASVAGLGAVTAACTQSNPSYDLLVINGIVIDPSQNIHEPLDVACKDGKIAILAPSLPSSDAREVLDAAGKIVAPGFIDIHVHVFPESTGLGIPADPNHIAKGVPTVIDAGSAGYYTWPGFRKWIIEVSATRIYSLINISYKGMMSGEIGELADIRYANPKLALECIEQNRDVILGVKIRLSRGLTGDRDIELLVRAREAAEAARLPMMVHIGGPYSPIGKIFNLMRKGDIMTHMYCGGYHGILNEEGKVVSAARKAFNKGIHFDVGHGRGGFSFAVAEQAIAQEFLPGTISSDLHKFNVDGPVYDQATTLSKFMLLGYSLDKVIELTTHRPAKLFKFNEQIGTLQPGAEADITILEQKEGIFEFTDSRDDTRTGEQKLIPWKTIKGGRIYQPPLHGS